MNRQAPVVESGEIGSDRTFLKVTVTVGADDAGAAAVLSTCPHMLAAFGARCSTMCDPKVLEISPRRNGRVADLSIDPPCTMFSATVSTDTIGPTRILRAYVCFLYRQAVLVFATDLVS